MENKEFDMEVTPERANYMKRTLLRLYADQMGMEIVSVTIVPANKAEDGTA